MCVTLLYKNTPLTSMMRIRGAESILQFIFSVISAKTIAVCRLTNYITCLIYRYANPANYRELYKLINASLFHQHHFLCINKLACLQPVYINSRCNFCVIIITAVPNRIIITGIFYFIN